MSHLHLVRMLAPGERRGRRLQKRPPTFTPAETARLRAALRHAVVLFGTTSCAAAALYILPNTFYRQMTGPWPVTGDVAVRLARALGKPIDALIRPLTSVERCPHCGATKAKRR